MTADRSSAGALAGVRVLEVGSGVAAPYCGKLFADLGATVVKVEPPNGDPARLRGPFLDDIPDPEASGLFLYLNTNKLGVKLDLAAPESQERLRKLLAWADLVIDDHAPLDVPAAGLDWPAVESTNPRASLVSITPFGQSGPYRDMPADEMTLFAMTSRMAAHRAEGRDPLRYFADLGWFQVGATAAVAALSALFAARRLGAGQHVDVAALEALAGNVDSFQIFASMTSGFTRPTPAHGVGWATGLLPCSDGHILMVPSGGERFFRRLLAAIDRQDLLGDPRFVGIQARASNIGELDAILLPWSLERTRRQAFEQLQAHRVMCAPVQSIEELFDDPQVRAREFFVEMGHPAAGKVKAPGAPFLMSKTPWSLRRPAPRLGQDNATVFAGALGDGGTGESWSAPSGAGSKPRLPLEGYTVIDLTEVWAGPMAASFLGDLGADVIRIESYPRATVTRAPGPPDQAPQRPWDRSPTYHLSNRNKRGIALNITDPRGRQVFEKLVAEADVLMAGFTAGTLDRMGLDYATLSAIKPDLVMLTMPGWGEKGPYKGYATLGSGLDAFAGHLRLRSYPDADTPHPVAIYHSDATGALSAAFAVMAALHHRDRTGEGQLIDMSQVEVLLTHMPVPVLEWTLNKRRLEPRGNAEPDAAPHGVYACEGENSWVAVAVRTDAQWSDLVRAIGSPAWAADGAFETAFGRVAARDRIDKELAAWTSQRSQDEAAAILLQAGVPAAPVLSSEKLMSHPQFEARGFFEWVDHPVVPRYRRAGPLWRMARTPLSMRRNANTLGEHNREVLCGRLGLYDAEYEELEQNGVIGDTYGPESD